MVAALAAGAGYSVWRDQFGHAAAARRAAGLEERPAVGFRAPTFHGVDALSGQALRLADLAGKPVLVNFFATWCAPCREEMPAIEAARRRWGSRAHAVAIDADSSEGADAIRRFAHSLGVSIPMLADPDGRIALAYAIRVLPTTFFIDPHGVIRQVVPRVMTPRMIEDGLEAAARG